MEGTWRRNADRKQSTFGQQTICRMTHRLKVQNCLERSQIAGNATVLGEKDRLGSITAGKLADIVLLTANPLDEIRNTRNIDVVLRGGRVCHPADLLRLVPKK